MTMRALASATLTFGMVQIPVRLYSAIESAEKISFNLLHKGCGSRLSQRYVCQAHKPEVVVEDEDRMRGYEVTKDSYVHFSDEEFAALEEPALESLEVIEFVPPRADRHDVLRRPLFHRARQRRRPPVQGARAGAVRNGPRRALQVRAA
jgi:DNA end-binding protein Ku